MELDERITNARELLAEARKHVQETAETVQAECPHMMVMRENDSHSANRICLACRLEETATFKKLKNSADRLVLNRDQVPGQPQFYSLRVNP